MHKFQVKADDNRPKSMCTECYQKLQHFSSNVDIVERNQKEIEKLAAVELEVGVLNRKGNVCSLKKI